MTKLTDKQKEIFDSFTKLQRAFFEFYVGQIEPNQTKAYLAACNEIGKKPSKNPRTSASEMLTNPNMVVLIEEFKQNAMESTQIGAE